MKRILVVEDEPDIRDLVILHLNGAGFETLEAGDGLSGLKLALEESPDLVALDLMLPDMNGEDMLVKMQADENARRIPVIMLTAKSQANDRIAGLELGADDYLTKPFSPKELVLRIQGLLKRTAIPKTEAPTELVSSFPREHWAVLGANDCGKTSLLRLIARYQMTSSGEVFALNNEDEIQEIRKNVGLVSSHIAQMIDPLETGFEVVLSGGQAMSSHWGMIDAEESRSAMRCLQCCGITRLADAPWGRLSQGERQRLLVARALMNPIQLLVLDDPCAGLDPADRENFLGLIQRIASRKDAPAIVFVTHHVDEHIEPFQKTLILSPKGRTLANGNNSQVLKAEALSEAFGAEVKKSKRVEPL